MTVLHVCKKGLKLVHGVFARVRKGIEVSSRGFARVQKGIEVGSRGFARVQKGIVVGSRGGVHVYKRALNDVKMVLYSEQFGLEVTSSRFCAVNN